MIQCCALQRATRSCIASPTSLTWMRRRDDRNGNSWTSRLITAEWDSQTPSGNSPPSTNTTRSVSRHLWSLVRSRPNMVITIAFWNLFCNVYPKVSDTYPAELFVPESASPPVIVGSSKFRSRGRFPTLSYYSKENHVSWPLHFQHASFSSQHQSHTSSLTLNRNDDAIAHFWPVFNLLTWLVTLIAAIPLQAAKKCKWFLKVTSHCSQHKSLLLSLWCCLKRAVADLCPLLAMEEVWSLLPAFLGGKWWWKTQATAISILATGEVNYDVRHHVCCCQKLWLVDLLLNIHASVNDAWKYVGRDC